MAEKRDIAVVTGGSRGIGVAIVHRLAQLGYHVIFTYVSDASAADGVARKVAEAGGVATPLKCELASEQDVRALMERAGSGPGKFSVLVNNAAVWSIEPLSDITDASFARTVDVNLKGPLFLAKHAAARLADGGRIVFISSIAGRIASPGYLLYSATKAALGALARGLAMQLGPRAITVNVLAPGVVNTELTQQFLKADPATVEGAIAQTAFKRMGEPEDIAGSVAMLVGPDANWVTGQVIESTGGMML